MKDTVTKCPKCWAEKAYLRETSGWPSAVLSYLFVVPMRCHHCFHKFQMSWFSTFGKQLAPPQSLRIAPGTSREAWAVDPRPPEARGPVELVQPVRKAA